MSQSYLVRGARQLLTLHGSSAPRRGNALNQLGLIQDGSVLVVDGIITNVGSTRRVENLAEARGAQEINAAGKVVLPAFVDSNCHLVGLPARQNEYRFPQGHDPYSDAPVEAELASLGANYLRNTAGKVLEAQARRTLGAMLRHGTTTVGARSGSGLSETAETKCLRVGQSVDDCATVISTFVAGAEPLEFGGTPEEYAQWLVDVLLPKIKSRKLARFADYFTASHFGNSAAATRFINAARSLGLVPAMVADTTSNSGLVELAVALQAASVNGLNFANEADIQTLAKSQTTAVLLPGTVHQGSYSRFAPARQMIDSDCVVALASGFHPGVSSTYSMQMVISLACTHMKMTAEEAINAATINSAHALQEAALTGSIEYGKRADLLMLNVSDYREIGYHFGINLVSLCMRAGEIVYKEGSLACTAS